MIFTALEDADDWLFTGTLLDVLIMLPRAEKCLASFTFRVVGLRDLNLQVGYEDKGGLWECTEWRISRADIHTMNNLRIHVKFHVDMICGPSLHLSRSAIPGRDVKVFGHSTVGTSTWTEDGCPECGHVGEWVRTALVCPNHGYFAGF